MKPRFVAGPPGTGKTHGYIVEKFKKVFKTYNPEKIILLSHTNVAAGEIKEAILKLRETIERGYRKKFFKYKICTIHSYCNHYLVSKELFEYGDHENLCKINSSFRRVSISPSDDFEKSHPFYRYIKAAHGNDLRLQDFWKKCNKNEYEPYNLSQLIEMNNSYISYKEKNNKRDYADMVKEFNELEIDSSVEVLIIDEAQDSNVPQMKAINKIASNVKDGHYYLVGDADQTTYEFAGSDAKKFHELSKNPYHELEEGKRCSVVINAKCKQIIKPIWDHYEYKRIWTPAKYTEKHQEEEKIPLGYKIGDYIQGKDYYLPDLKGSPGLTLLLEKINNTNHTFLFTGRYYGSTDYFRQFFIHHGLEFAHVKNVNNYVSKKEINCHHLWPQFRTGKPLPKKQISDFRDYLGIKAVPKGKWPKEIIKEFIDKDYTIDELILKGYLRNNIKELGSFDMIRTKATKTKDHDKRMIYIKKVLTKGFNSTGKIRIEYGNIHDVKGLTRDNVIVDLSQPRAEDYHVQLRLKYTAYSRGIFDCWTLASRTRRELGRR